MATETPDSTPIPSSTKPLSPLSLIQAGQASDSSVMALQSHLSSDLAIIALRRTVNSRHDPLPTEMWRFVFSHFGGVDEPREHLIAATHVCHAWREYLISKSIFWTVLRVHNNWACKHPRPKRARYSSCPGYCRRGFWSDTRLEEYDKANEQTREALQIEAKAYRVRRAMAEVAILELFLERSRASPFRLNLSLNHAPCDIITAGIEIALGNIQSSGRLLHFDFEFGQDHSEQARRIIRKLRPDSAVEQLRLDWCLEWNPIYEDESYSDVHDLLLAVEQTVAVLPVRQMRLGRGITWGGCMTTFSTLTTLEAYFSHTGEMQSCIIHCPRLQSLVATLDMADFYDPLDEWQQSLQTELSGLRRLSISRAMSARSTFCEIVQCLAGDAGGTVRAIDHLDLHLNDYGDWHGHNSYRYGSGSGSGYYHPYGSSGSIARNEIYYYPLHQITQHLGDFIRVEAITPMEVHLRMAEDDYGRGVPATLVTSSVDGSRSRRLVMGDGFPKSNGDRGEFFQYMWEALLKYNVISLEAPLNDLSECLRTANSGQLNGIRSLSIIVHGDQYEWHHAIEPPKPNQAPGRGDSSPLRGVEEITLEQFLDCGSRSGGTCSFSLVSEVMERLAKAGVGSFGVLNLNLNTSWTRENLQSAYTFARRVYGIPEVKKGWFHHTKA